MPTTEEPRVYLIKILIRKGVVLLKTKFYRKALSILLTAITIMSVFAVAAVEVSAADASIVSITVDEVKRRYKDSATFLNYCNEYRANQDLSSWVMDTELMEAAMVKAAGLAVYVDEYDLDGTSFLDDKTQKRGLVVGYDVSINSGLIDIFLQDDVYRSNFNSKVFKSVGIGVVEVMKIKYVCILLSDKTPSEVSSSVLTQSNKTISQELSCKSEYLKDIRMVFQDNEQIACGADLTAELIVTNQFYPEAMAYISGTSADISSSDLTIIRPNSNGTITGLKSGTATVTMKIKNAPSISASAKLRVVAETFDNCTISKIADQVYTGTALTPAVTIVDEDGNKLVSGRDYNLSYSNNINPGTASVKITGIGAYAGAIATATFKINGSTDTFSVVLKSNKTSMEVGQTATLSATVTNGTAPIKYKFESAASGSTSFTTVQAESTSSSCSYTPSAAGTYTLRVTAKDNSGKTAVSNVTISVSPKLSVSLSISSNTLTLGGSITFTAQSSGGTSPYTFSFSIMEPGSSSYTTLTEFSSLKTYSYTPKNAGTYQVRVSCKGGNDVTAYNTAGFVVNAPALVNSSTISTTNITLGNSATVTGKASGGVSPYTYAYYYKNSSSSSWTTVSAFSSKTSAVIKPTAAGTYTVKVTVKDSAGTTTDKTFSLIVTNVTPLTNLSTVSATSIAAGNTVTVSGKATGGTSPYKYAFYYKKSTDTAWKTIGTEFGTETSGTFKATPAAVFNVKIIVKDNKSTTAEKTYDVTATSTLANNSVLSASVLPAGKAVTITGKASGGTSPYKYAFYYKRAENSSWKLLGTEYGTATTASFTPASSGSFDVKVNVKDNIGTVVTKKLTYTAAEPLVNSSTINTTKAVVGGSVTLTAKISGGTSPYKYAYYYKKTENSTWKVIGTEFGTAATATFVPQAAGTYDICIKGKDSTGTLSSKTLSLSVSDLANKSGVNYSKVGVGTYIAVNGKAEGGTAPYKYAFYFKRAVNSNWNTIGTEYGTAATGEFKPTAAADYNIKINIKDSVGYVATKILTVTATDLENTSTISASKVGTGTPVEISGKASGGKSGYTYAFYFKRATNTNWSTLGTAFGTATTATLTPTAVADYNIKVIAKDANSAVSVKTFTVSATDLANKSTVNYTKVGTGTTVRITGKASGGKSTYKYAFYFKRSTNTNWNTLGTAYGTATTASFTPTAVADYDVKIIVKDSNSAISKKTYKITASNLANNSTLSSTSVKANQSVTLTGNASGGKSSYTYAFYYKRSENTSWKTIGTAFGTATKATFKPTAAATYNIKIVVKDANGAVSEKSFTLKST